MPLCRSSAFHIVLTDTFIACVLMLCLVTLKSILRSLAISLIIGGVWSKTIGSDVMAVRRPALFSATAVTCMVDECGRFISITPLLP